MTRVIREQAAETLLVLLPDVPVAGDATAHWWRIESGAIVARGVGSEWLEPAARRIGLAPATRVRTVAAMPSERAANPRQAIGIQRNSLLEESLGEAETLHAVTVARGDGQLVTTIAANATMLEWLDWAEAMGTRLDHIVPTAMVLPLGEHWVRATVGSDAILGRNGMVIPDEPALTDALVDPELGSATLDRGAIDSELLQIAADPVPDLRSGRFAARRVIVNRSTLRQLALLAILIGLVTLVTALVEIVRLERSRATLDAQSLALAQNVLGPGATLDTAEAELAMRAGGGGMSPLVAALLQRLQAEPDVALTTLGYARDTLSITLDAASLDAINRTLAALQRDGYRVSAVPRQGSNGRSVADVTVRGVS